MGRKKKISKELGKNCLFKVLEVDENGELKVEPVDKLHLPKGTEIYATANRKIKPALASGDVFLARISDNAPQGALRAVPLMRVEMNESGGEKIYGIIIRRNGNLYLKQPSRKNFMDYLLDDARGVREDDFVSAVIGLDRRFRKVRIIKNFGKFNLAKAMPYLLFEQAGVPDEFSEKAEKEAAKLGAFEREGREDLTRLPLVTIDGEDSKDFDDAVYAEKTAGGFRLIVAIADVCYYVREGSELDREAYKRGNSVYLPGMVLPMLPVHLSNGICSLNPREERPVVACIMEIDRDGNLKSHRFCRAVMKSAGRLTYKEVQKAFEGEFNDNTRLLFKKAIQPLYEAYFALDKARERRGAINIESDEIKIRVSESGVVESVSKAELYTSNKVIEEFMIAANVAAALTLKGKGVPVMYRIHDKPPETKLKEMLPLMHNLKLKLPDYGDLKPGDFNRLLAKGEKEGLSDVFGNLVLRMQSQASYSPENIGHFGLALKEYVHFTSPIRRYADLLIHRALVRVLALSGGGGLPDADNKLFKEIGDHLLATERRATVLEREMKARFLSAYLEPLTGTDFEVKISGVARSGVFVAIEGLGAEGFIPMHTLPGDDYVLEEGGWELKGLCNGRKFGFGDKIIARLVEAMPITGGLLFKYVDEAEGIAYYEKATCRVVSAEEFRRGRKPSKAKAPKSKRKKMLKANNQKKKKQHD